MDAETGASWAVWLYPGQAILRLYKVQEWNIDNGFTTLATAPGVDMTPGVYHHLSVEVSGGIATVLWDQTQIMSYDLGVTSTGGSVALDVSNKPVCFDDVLFYQIDRPATPFPQRTSPITLFQDDFASGIDDWAASPLVAGSWTLTPEETLENGGGGHTQLYIPGLSCGDCTATVNVTLTSPDNYPGGVSGSG